MGKEGEAAGVTPGVSGPIFLKGLEDLLVTLRRTSKDLAFYPPDHPLLKASLENARSQLHAVVGARGSLALTVSRAGFSFEGCPVGKEHRQLAAMAGELFVRRIQQIGFEQDVGMEELAAFLRMISTDSKQLQQQGGPVKVLAGRGVRRIQVSEMDFRRLSETKDATGRTDEPTDAIREQSAAPEAQPRATSSKSQEVSPFAALLSTLAIQGDPTVDELIQRLEREAASGKTAGYEWVASRLENAAGQGVRADRVQDVVAILRIFLRHQRADPLGAPLRDRAARAVETIAAGKTVPYLVEHLGTAAGAPAEDLAAVLGDLGARVIPPLFGRLAAVGDRGVAREALVVILARLSEMAQPELSRALREADKDQAFQLVPLLGRFGGEASVVSLSCLIRHQDARVRREVVRELGRIGGESAHRLLLQALRDPDPAVLEVAVGLAGAARVKLAIPALLRLAGQRVLAGRPFAVRKAAVAALGAMGDPGSVSTLAGVLGTRSWFRRAAGNRLRLAAALALLSMARPEAREAVEAGARSRRRDVRRACTAALERLPTPEPRGE